MEIIVIKITNISFPWY